MPPVKLPPGAVAVDDSPKLPPGAVAVEDQEAPAPSAPPAPVSDTRNAAQKLIDSFTPQPGTETGTSFLHRTKELAKGGVGGVMGIVSHPLQAGAAMVQPFLAAGMAPGGMYPTTAATGRPQDLEANKQVQTDAQQGQADAAKFMAAHPNYTAGSILGPALVTHGLTKAFTKAIAPRAPAMTDGQTSALSSVLARTPMNSDKGFIVQDVADAIKDPLRQAAADNPQITAVALGKDPVKAYGAYQALLTKTKQAFEKTYSSVLGPERNYPVDGHAIASQLSSSDALRRMFPNEAEWVDDFYARLGTVKTLGELDDVRKLLNDRVKSTYKNAAPTMEEGGKVGATRAGLDLMRQYFYFKLEEATGQDMSGLKRTEGAVMDAERAGVANGPQLTSAHQKHVEPATPARKVAGIIKGAKVATGNFALPVAGYVADALEGSNLQQLHSYLKRALSDLPPPTPAGVTPPPAPMPPNSPKLGPGGPGTALQTAPPQGPRPVGSVQYPNPTGIAAPPPSARPRGLGSMAPAPQLQSGPAAYAGPNTVNAATASTQIAPTLAERTAAPPSAPPPGTGMVVAPDGTITLPRKMLQAPAKVGDIINFQGKKMQVAKVFKDGQTALKEVTPPAAPKGKGQPAPTKAAAKPAPPIQTPAQMTDSYAAGPEPEGLGGPSVLKGTPIPATAGAKTQLVLPGNRTMPATYQIVESTDLTPSHDPFSFAKNERYPENVQERNYATSKEAQARVVDQEQKFNPDLVINTNPDAVNGPPIITPDGTVLGGNSRAMTVSRVYRNSGGDAYRNALKAQAQTYGIDPAKVDGMRRPVLVRVVDSPGGLESTRRLASDLNRPLTAALGESEKAVSTGRNIKPATMNWISDELSQNDSTLRELMAARGPAILSKLVDDGAIAERERPQYIDSKTGGLNEAGKTFVEKALIGKVLDDPGLIDSTPKAVLQKVERSLGAITSFAQRTDEWNLAPAIRYAVNELGKAQRTGMSTEDFLSQGSLLEAQRNPLLSHLVRAIDGKPTTLRNALMTFAHDAAANPEGQPSFFGGASAHDAFNNAFGTHLTDEEFRRGIEEAQEHER